MQLGSDIQIRDGLLAEMMLLREKPRLGFGHAESTVHQGLKAANYLNHVRDTTTVVRYSWQMSLMAQQQQPADQPLTNVVYNETGSLRADPNAKPGAPGSAQDLANGQQAVAEIANRVMNAGHPDRVAPDSLTAKGAAAVKTDPNAIDAYGRSRTAADAALGGSNISNGAMQYRTRVGDNVTTSLGRSSTSRGTPISQHYGPFIEGKHSVVIVVAP
ncbi:hypothetical protein GOB94_00030 [Granulicella sp. 5B5]|uniref:hypothetical protein n=1 Tax=Granulicella sp. 5B5 TaxID=1617967 RepID=UPI0015F4BD84|nr:hypothetical protein [Granulicella sp. 5B5]QMV17273.1 hypothetical protein GOB94_00030 [Granulicella sp. 5B5]